VRARGREGCLLLQMATASWYDSVMGWCLSLVEGVTIENVVLDTSSLLQSFLAALLKFALSIAAVAGLLIVGYFSWSLIHSSGNGSKSAGKKKSKTERPPDATDTVVTSTAEQEGNRKKLKQKQRTFQ
jgi:hypothetical protein